MQAIETLKGRREKSKAGRKVSASNSIETLEGGGFLVRRRSPRHRFQILIRFCCLDEMGPMDVAPGEAKGAPDHPHRPI